MVTSPNALVRRPRDCRAGALSAKEKSPRNEDRALAPGLSEDRSRSESHCSTGRKEKKSSSRIIEVSRKKALRLDDIGISICHKGQAIACRGSPGASIERSRKAQGVRRPSSLPLCQTCEAVDKVLDESNILSDNDL